MQRFTPTLRAKFVHPSETAKGELTRMAQQLSEHVMAVVTERKEGLFPLPREISLSCDCPDWAVMCKHVAAVLYGVGARLDRTPELLFRLRGVDHEELIVSDAEAAVTTATSRSKSKRLADGELSDVFGIDLDTSGESVRRTRCARRVRDERRQTRFASKRRRRKPLRGSHPRSRRRNQPGRPRRRRRVPRRLQRERNPRRSNVRGSRRSRQRQERPPRRSPKRERLPQDRLASRDDLPGFGHAPAHGHCYLDRA